MLQWRRWSDDDGGSASLEFVTAGMILLLPLVYLVLTMASIQAGALAVEGAARQAVRVFVQAGSTRQAEAEAAMARAQAKAAKKKDAAEEDEAMRVKCFRLTSREN